MEQEMLLQLHLEELNLLVANGDDDALRSDYILYPSVLKNYCIGSYDSSQLVLCVYTPDTYGVMCMMQSLG
jgi:hypothetical protein